MMKVDKASMAESVEARAPYLDRRVAELAYRTPREWLMRDGENKYLLRELARSRRLLPAEASGRVKFGAPLGASWMDDDTDFRALRATTCWARKRDPPTRAGRGDERLLRSGPQRLSLSGRSVGVPQPRVEAAATGALGGALSLSGARCGCSCSQHPSKGADSMRVIYDFGSNNGDDIPYYLKKGDLVIAVEANPALAENIRERFQREIAQGDLVILNCVLVKEASAGPVPFYIHRTEHVLSQYPPPAEAQLHNFDQIFVASRKASDIIRAYGSPHYVKVDIEQFDQCILEEIFAEGIRPEFLSAESHSIEIFALLWQRGDIGHSSCQTGRLSRLDTAITSSGRATVRSGTRSHTIRRDLRRRYSWALV